jgi:hypothetical protein
MTIHCGKCQGTFTSAQAFKDHDCYMAAMKLLAGVKK